MHGADRLSGTDSSAALLASLPPLPFSPSTRRPRIAQSTASTVETTTTSFQTREGAPSIPPHQSPINRRPHLSTNVHLSHLNIHPSTGPYLFLLFSAECLTTLSLTTLSTPNHDHTPSPSPKHADTEPGRASPGLSALLSTHSLPPHHPHTSVRMRCAARGRLNDAYLIKTYQPSLNGIGSAWTYSHRFTLIDPSERDHGVSSPRQHRMVQVRSEQRVSPVVAIAASEGGRSFVHHPTKAPVSAEYRRDAC